MPADPASQSATGYRVQTGMKVPMLHVGLRRHRICNDDHEESRCSAVPVPVYLWIRDRVGG